MTAGRRFPPLGRRHFCMGLASLAATPSLVLSARAAAVGDVVETGSGKVQGYREGGVQVFKGIPYGEATGGSNRFLPPRAFAARAGLWDATKFGPSCPQLNGRLNQAEDCLVLNIWTPGAERGRKRPVMFHIHGGGFRTGTSAFPSMDGTHLAQAEDVVVVSMNHRLGPLGYLYLGDILGGEYEIGNAGNLDLVLALRWVRDNIDAFGGDPGCVTMFGVSGGGKKISHLLAMPSAQGLFHRAIVMSGALSTAIARPAASAYAERFLATVGLERGSASKLLEMPVDVLLKAVSALSAARQDPEGGYGGGGGPQPLVDGHSLPRHPGEAVAAGMSAGVPVMIGSALDEPIAGYQAPAGLRKLEMMSEADVHARLADGPFVRLGDRAGEVLAHYRKVWPDLAPGALMVRVETAGSWRFLSNLLADEKASARGAPTWVYVMTFAGGTPGGPRGASHATDVPLVMGTYADFTELSPTPWFAGSPGVEQVSRMMGRTWCAFGRTGNPNNALLPRWPAYSARRRETMLLDRTSHVVNDPFGDSRILPTR